MSHLLSTYHFRSLKHICFPALFLVILCTSYTNADYSVLNLPKDTSEDNDTKTAEKNITLPKVNLPQCVNITKNQGWLSLTGPIEVDDCVETLALIQNASNGIEDEVFNFYSKQFYPNGPPDEGDDWALPVGAETCMAFLSLLSLHLFTVPSTLLINARTCALTRPSLP